MRFSSMLLIALAAIASIGRASAEDNLKLAVGQRGNWGTSVAEVGQLAGIFKRHGLLLELLYTQGSGETQQAVIAESVDIGIAAGTMGVMSAFAKGAPVRILEAETTGASDIYWYVKADSPIKTIQDFDGKTIAYSTVGSSDSHGGHGIHQTIQSPGRQGGRNWQSVSNAHAGHVRTSRRRLGRRARRAGST